MRLIDEEDVISLLANHHFDDDKENYDLLIHNLCKEVKHIPTAYDANEVVEQMNNEFMVVKTDDELMWNRAMDRAIEIVRGGGTQ